MKDTNLFEINKYKLAYYPDHNKLKTANNLLLKLAKNSNAYPSRSVGPGLNIKDYLDGEPWLFV